MISIGDQYACPICDRVGYYKPPYNTPDECMSCRWEREHPAKPRYEHEKECSWCGKKLWRVVLNHANGWAHEALEKGETCRLLTFKDK